MGILRYQISTCCWIKQKWMFRILFILYNSILGQEIYFCSGHQYLHQLSSYASCDLRKSTIITYYIDLSMFYNKSWNISLEHMCMFFFDMFSGYIFTIKSLFTNGTLKSCEIQMSVIMTLQIFFIPKILWRRIWFNY